MYFLKWHPLQGFSKQRVMFDFCDKLLFWQTDKCCKIESASREPQLYKRQTMLFYPIVRFLQNNFENGTCK